MVSRRPASGAPIGLRARPATATAASERAESQGTAPPRNFPRVYQPHRRSGGVPSQGVNVPAGGAPARGSPAAPRPAPSHKDAERHHLRVLALARVQVKEGVLKVDDAMITNCDEIIHKALNNSMVVNIPIQGSMEGEHGGPPVNNNNNDNIVNDQDSTENEEATELDQSSPFADVVKDITWVESQVLVKDPDAASTINEVTTRTFEIHPTTGSVREREPSAIQILNSRCQMNEIHLTALNDEVQTLRRDKEILKTGLNKAEEEVKLLSEENRTLHESNKVLLRSEKKHSASDSIKIHDGINHHTTSTHTVVDIHQCSTDGEHGPVANNANMNNNIPGDQEFSEGEEPTELHPKDKGLYNFMKPVSCAALGVICPLSFASFALVGSAGYPTISNSQKECLLLSTGVFFLFSLITCGVIHALEGRAKDIDLATTMVIAEIAYVIFVLCLDAMFFVEVPWFIIPFGLILWLVLTGWLVRRFRRPMFLYTPLRMLRRFLFKVQMQ